MRFRVLPEQARPEARLLKHSQMSLRLRYNLPGEFVNLENSSENIFADVSNSTNILFNSEGYPKLHNKNRRSVQIHNVNKSPEIQK